MKRILLLSAGILWLYSAGLSGQSKAALIDMREQFIELAGEKAVFTQMFEQPGKNKDQLFLLARSFVMGLLRTDTDVVLVDDVGNGVVAARVNSAINIIDDGESEYYQQYTSPMSYYIRIQCKHEQVRLSISDFYITYAGSGEMPYVPLTEKSCYKLNDGSETRMAYSTMESLIVYVRSLVFGVKEYISEPNESNRWL